MKDPAGARERNLIDDVLFLVIQKFRRTVFAQGIGREAVEDLASDEGFYGHDGATSNRAEHCGYEDGQICLGGEEEESLPWRLLILLALRRSTLTDGVRFRA